MWEFFQKFGEEQEKAIKNNFEILKTIKEYGLEDKKFFGGDKNGYPYIGGYGRGSRSEVY